MAGVSIGSELLDGALADSVHDFKIPNVITKNKDGVTLGDVFLTLPDKPTGAYSAKSEHDMLHKIFGKDPKKNPIRELIEDIEKEKAKGNDKVLRLTVNGLAKFDYTVNYLSHVGENGIINDMRSIKDKVSLRDYDTFFNLKGSPLNIVIDAQSIGMKKLFSFAKKDEGSNLVINSIINREVVNDPASKIYDVSKFLKKDGLTYNVLREDNTENIKYTSFDTPDNPLLRNKFYSTLDLTLSPLLNTNNKGLPRITLDILNKQKELIYQTGNPHLDNAISSCWNLIKKWFGSKTDKHIRSSSFFQCKRSGDWLQALSCIDIDRPYLNDTDNSRVAINNLKLVTLDQILLWYSLIIGIDVIFTCTMPAKPEEDAADAGEPEDSNDGIDDDELAAGPGKPKKILLYFTRSTPEPPEAKLARYKAMAKANAAIDYKAKINKYNSLIQEVVNDIEAEIDGVFHKVMSEIGKAKSLVKGITTGTKELLQLNWKLTALDYKELDEPVKPAKRDEEKIEKLSQYISECSSIDLIVNSVKTKDDIVFNSKAYEINEEYLKLIDPFFDLSAMKSRGGESAEIRCAKSCSHLKFRLPDVYIRNLVAMLKGIRDLIKEKWPKIAMDKFALVKIIALLEVDNMDSISDIIVGYLKKKNTSTEIQAAQKDRLTDEDARSKAEDEDTSDTDPVETKYIEEIKGKIEKDTVDLKADYTDEKEFEFEYIEEVVRVLRSRIVTKKVLVQKVAPVVPVVPKIKRAMTSGTEDLDVKEYAQILLSLLGVRVQAGGGSPSKDKSVYAYALFLIYLNSLIDSLNGYEMMNGTDYIYFDAVARIVLSAIQVTKTDHLSLLDTVYIEMLDTEWIDEFSSLESKDFKECVQVAAQNLALQSLNLRSGPMPYDTYKGSKKILEDIRFDSEFKKITATLKGKSFYDRKLYVISRIESYIKSSSMPTSTPPMPVYPIVLKRRNPLQDHQLPYINEAYNPRPLKIRGGKTRSMKKKRKNGSPRRKTLRKTRRHR